MKLLLLSNQAMEDGVIGNPIMLRLRDVNYADPRIEEVKMLRCNDPFSVRDKLRKYAKECDIIHIHFGGLYALIVWFLLIGVNRPKIITFHGSDIHAKTMKTAKNVIDKIRIIINQKASFLCIKLYDKCGFVAKEMLDYVPRCLHSDLKRKAFIQKLGVDYNVFIPIDKAEAQHYLGLKPGHYVLFSDVHNTTIKRRDIALKIIENLPGYHLLIMCGVSSNIVPYYINASDFLILTSDEEGSPNIIRECLSLNKPVFSVDVGDSTRQLAGLKNSKIISRDPLTAKEEILTTIEKEYIDNTRENKRELLDFKICNSRVIDIYSEILNQN